mmetsp:Transcript_25412/g.52884  ORF Transcript_25412/g.52884 Transcript_25412/m.52884 type:complete len:208 (+) Transcript_25412:1617-2240(+)
MIGGFIQQEELGFNKKRAGQGHAHPPTSRKFACRHVQHGIGKSQTMQNGRGTSQSLVGIKLIQSIVHTFEGGLNLRLFVFRDIRTGHGIIQKFGLFLQTFHFIIGFHDGLQGGNIIARGIFGIQKENIEGLGNGNTPCGNGFHNGGFPGTIRTNESVPIAIVDDQLGIFNERFAMKGDCDTTDIDIAGIGMQFSLFGFVIDHNVLLR